VRYDDVLFLSVQQVEQIHAVALREHGGSQGCVAPSLLESAVFRPRATFAGAPLYGTLAAMTASLIYGIAKNHAFRDGNKRTALSAGVAFLHANGHPLPFDPAWEGHLVAVAAGKMSEDRLAEVIASAIGDVRIEA
jgi:death-on-curing protein